MSEGSGNDGVSPLPPLSPPCTVPERFPNVRVSESMPDWTVVRSAPSVSPLASFSAMSLTTGPTYRFARPPSPSATKAPATGATAPVTTD